MKPEQIIVISDLHAGSKYGLCPPEGIQNEDTTIKPTDRQKILLNEHWFPFWEAMQKETGGKAHVHVNGDVTDGTWARLGPHQLTNIGFEQGELAYDLLSPVKEKYKSITFVRGTGVHVGSQGQQEESIAKRLKAVKLDNLYSHWALEIEMSNGAIVDFKHHGPINQPRLKAGFNIDAEYQNTLLEHMERKAEGRPPDMVVRSHGHQLKKSGAGTYLAEERALQTPAWQYMTPYGFKVTSARNSNINIGGILLRVEKGRVRVIDEYVWKLKTAKRVRL